MRIITITIAIIGMLTIFGLGVQFPMPKNVGDWMGIGSGVLWAIAMVRLRVDPAISAIDMTLGFFFWSLTFSILAVAILAPSYVPSVAQILPAMPLLLIFMALLILPGTYASLWGPKFLSPGVVGLLFMTEIVVGAISVALLSGEPFGIREVIGIILIAGASLMEPIASLVKRSEKLV
jgi:drug/metabolite transporter (DMT)-like permease